MKEACGMPTSVAIFNCNHLAFLSLSDDIPKLFSHQRKLIRVQLEKTKRWASQFKYEPIESFIYSQTHIQDSLDSII